MNKTKEKVDPYYEITLVMVDYPGDDEVQETFTLGYGDPALELFLEFDHLFHKVRKDGFLIPYCRDISNNFHNFKKYYARPECTEEVARLEEIANDEFVKTFLYPVLYSNIGLLAKLFTRLDVYYVDELGNKTICTYITNAEDN